MNNIHLFIYTLNIKDKINFQIIIIKIKNYLILSYNKYIFLIH